MTETRAGAPVLEPAELDRYADAVVRACLALEPGDVFVLYAELAHRECAVALVESAYRAGASVAEIVYAEPRARAARIRHAPDDRLGTVPPWELAQLRALTRREATHVHILADAEPDVFADLPAERVATDFALMSRRLRAVRRAAQAGRRRWTGISWPTPLWAGRVYPELDPGDRERRLARDLLHFCRLGPDDPPGHEGWLRHRATLVARAEALTGLDLRRLHLRGPGTELELRLAPGSRWLGTALAAVAVVLATATMGLAPEVSSRIERNKAVAATRPAVEAVLSCGRLGVARRIPARDAIPQLAASTRRPMYDFGIYRGRGRFAAVLHHTRRPRPADGVLPPWPRYETPMGPLAVAPSCNSFG